MSVALFVLSLAVILQSSQECSSTKIIELEIPVNVTRMIEGVLPQYRELPYIVSMESRWGGYPCSGTILNSEWVITAANCTRNLEEIKEGSDYKVFGTTHRVIDKRFPGKVVQFVKHDIALLKITPPIKFRKTVKPAILPKHNQETRNGTRAIVAVWGSDRVDDSRPTHLFKVDVTVLDMEDCRRPCRRTSIPNNPPDRFVNICAVAPYYQMPSYRAEFGGPLTANGEIIGIASFVTLCCRSKFCPTVYTKVSKYIPWIMSTIGNR